MTQEIITSALGWLLTERRSNHAWGFVVEGVGELDVPELLRILGEDGTAYVVSLVGWEGDHEDLLDRVSTDVHVGFGAAHAVGQRNDAPEDAVRVALAWRQEARLNSLYRRNYEVVGPDAVGRAIALAGVRKAENEPQRAFWSVLAESDLSGLFGLHRMADFSARVRGEQADPLDGIREALTCLGLFQDRQLLSGRYASAEGIQSRLMENRELVNRFLRGDDDDKRRALQAIKGTEGEGQSALKAAYKAFARATRGEQDALGSVEFTWARQLLRSPSRMRRRTRNDEDEEDDDPPEGPVRYDSPERAALELFADGRAEQLTETLEAVKEAIEEDQIKDGTHKGEEVEVKLGLDSRAVVLAQLAFQESRYGGLIAEDMPVNGVLTELARHAEGLRPYDEIRLEQLREHLRRARRVAPDFEGFELLEEFLAARRLLVPFRGLLSTSPLACLLADNEAFEAAEALTAAYRRLLGHLREAFPVLQARAPEGARQICQEVFALDSVLVRGSGEEVAILGPINPLALWKYLELARVIKNRGSTLDASDRDLLQQEIDNLPEPLLTVRAPRGAGREEAFLGYSGQRVGTMPIYRRGSFELADVSGATIEYALRKLVVLYPPAKQLLRITLVDPVCIDEAARAIKGLRDKAGVERVLIRVVKTRDRRGRLSVEEGEGVLDELDHEGLIEIEEEVVADDAALARRIQADTAHALVLAGLRERNIETVHREATRLHPLSVPHRLLSDPITNKVDLRPRSSDPSQSAGDQPYGLYHDLQSEISGNSRVERTVGEVPSIPMSVLRPLLPHCQVLIVSGVPERESDLDLVRLSHGRGVQGDTVFTAYPERIFRGLDGLLRSMNYVPQEAGIKHLVDLVEETSGVDIFSTVSESNESGFSPSALRGVLGVAVALSWYQGQTSPDNHVIISTDSGLARHWLKARSDDRRTDLLGIGRGQDGQFCLDVIEVKSYEATGSSDVLESHAADQLRSVARLLREMLTHQGNVLIDRRRELLRRQVYLEGLLLRANAAPEWVETLNAIIDGDEEVAIRATLIELAFEENIAADVRVFGSEAADELPIRRIRLGEHDIQKHLQAVVQVDLPERGGAESRWTSASPEVAKSDREGRGESGVPGGGEGAQAEPGDLTSGDGVGEINDEGVAGGGQEPGAGFEPDAEEMALINAKAKEIYRALKDLNVQVAEPVVGEEADIGPALVRYKVRLRPEQRLSGVQSRARDLMRELAAEREPRIDVLPNTNLIYVDLPRPERQPALLPVVTALKGRSDDRLELPVGVTPDGRTFTLAIAELPHMLVAGSTGSGKTMFLYSVIAGILDRYDPEQVQMVLIDPKQTDFVFFEGLPHLRGGRVIVDPREAIEVIGQLLTDELQERTERLREARQRDIRAFNATGSGEPMAPIVVIIDEFADLADAMAKDERAAFDETVRRLAQRARNVGIHLVLATQRPTADIVNGTIKANLPCRVSFRLASNVDSQTILDEVGAEKLLGMGDMLLKWNGRVQRLQGYLVSEERLRNLEAD